MKSTLLLISSFLYVTLAWGQIHSLQNIPAEISPEDTARLIEAGEVYYSDFGAQGDGQTDDIGAIAATHQFANQHGLTVKADDQATYYIGGKEQTVDIQTNTDFGTASFLIDDTEVDNRNASVFRVSSELQPLELTTVNSLRKNQTKIAASLSGPTLIRVTNTNVKHYIRLGSNQDNGSSQTDIFMVDQEGNVDESTPIIWDFDQITGMTALPIDPEENLLTITGGRFTTLANRDASEYNYYRRNFEVNRSHVVVDGMEHTIRGEGDQGAPYAGFLNVYNCAYVTIKNTALTGHKTYYTIGSAGKSVAMGSYDITVGNALNVSLVNCHQTNDINDRQYWGIMASNNSKNLLYDNCVLSRFDAHRGVNNATIRGSTLGHMGINAIGGGVLTLENTTVYANHLINLRADYGSTWEGEVVIRDCTFAPDASRTNRVALMGGYNSSQHDFGYPCYLPEQITIENLRIDDAQYPEDYPGPMILADFNPELKDASYQEDFPYIRTGEVVLDRVTIASGQALRLSDNPFMFKDVMVTELEEPSQEETITVRAQGSTGEEQVVLQADGVPLGENITLSTTMASYSRSVEVPYTDIRIVFVNDGTSDTGADRNVRVDYLVIGADTLQAEDQQLNTGSWSEQGGCGSGGPSEWLYCGGYLAFERSGNNVSRSATTFSQLNELLPETATVRMYPNPSRGSVLIHLPTTQGEAKEVRVLDLTGRAVYHQRTTQSVLRLSASQLPPATYIVEVATPGQHWAERLVVE